MLCTRARELADLMLKFSTDVSWGITEEAAATLRDLAGRLEAVEKALADPNDAGKDESEKINPPSS